VRLGALADLPVDRLAKMGAELVRSEAGLAREEFKPRSSFAFLIVPCGRHALSISTREPSWRLVAVRVRGRVALTMRKEIGERLNLGGGTPAPGLTDETGELKARTRTLKGRAL
jgi:hypothetical protein